MEKLTPNQKFVTISMDNVPTWAKVAVLLGVPALIALYLTVFVTQDLKTSMAATETLARLNNAALARVEDNMNHLLIEQVKTNRFLAQLCLISSQTQEDRRACLAIQ